MFQKQEGKTQTKSFGGTVVTECCLALKPRRIILHANATPGNSATNPLNMEET